MADVTLVNLNLLYMRYAESVDRELHVPLGTLYLARALEDAGFTVDVRDYQLFEGDDPFDVENLLSFLGDPAPVVGFSCMANLLPFTLLAMRAFSERHPSCATVLGGVGPKAVERRVLERFGWVRVIHRGEGERSGPALVDALLRGRPLESVPNLFLRGPGGEVVETPRAERVEDLDEIPFPAFEKIDLGRYAGYGMMTSRGCPYPCTFCSVAPVWDYRSTRRSPENIVAEMEHLHREAGVDLFLFQDEFFLSGPRQVLAFCRALRRSGLDVEWKAFGRVNLTDEETMRAMADAGCIELRFGIESASDEVLRRTRKGFSPAEAVEVVGRAVDLFPRIDAFYVWGFPFETLDDFHASVFQMVSFRMMGARILPSLLCFLPQTPLYEEYRGDRRFSFCETLLPEYMITGHEISDGARVRLDERHRAFFDLVRAHPDVFPGFYHYDLEGNVLPKLRILQEFGFYPAESSRDPESCGAHSPRRTAAETLATRTRTGENGGGATERGTR